LKRKPRGRQNVFVWNKRNKIESGDRRRSVRLRNGRKPG
jgi:hypothetical protein